MQLLRQLDPEGVEQRKSRRLKRRSYKCKVNELAIIIVWIIKGIAVIIRDLINYGMLMVMISSLRMDSPFTVASMGMF